MLHLQSVDEWGVDMISEMKRACKHLDTLRERKSYLARKIEQFGHGDLPSDQQAWAAASYWRAEQSALAWAIKRLEQVVGYDEKVRAKHREDDKRRSHEQFVNSVFGGESPVDAWEKIMDFTFGKGENE